MMTKAKVVAVIPARFGSTRLPGKPLLDICGKSMIQRVFERVKLVECIDDIVVATDDQRIVTEVERFGGLAIMTDPSHQSGTDRLVEVKSRFNADYYLNIQGDEPLIEPEHVSLLANYMIKNKGDVVTLCHEITTEESLNPNSVKVVKSHNDKALYFSRAPIPYPRSSFKCKYFKHIGVYIYSADVLDKYSALPNSMLEETELLEQLRLLEGGTEINVLTVDSSNPGVDTESCLERVRRIVSQIEG